MAKALEQGYTDSEVQPYHGYYFKVLKGKVLRRPWERWTSWLAGL